MLHIRYHLSPVEPKKVSSYERSSKELCKALDKPDQHLKVDLASPEEPLIAHQTTNTKLWTKSSAVTRLETMVALLSIIHMVSFPPILPSWRRSQEHMTPTISRTSRVCNKIPIRSVWWRETWLLFQACRSQGRSKSILKRWQEHTIIITQKHWNKALIIYSKGRSAPTHLELPVTKAETTPGME